MKKNIVLAALLLASIVSCRKENTVDEPLLVGPEEEVSDTIASQENNPEKGINELKLLTDEFISGKKEVERQLKTLSKTDANKLYKTYHEKSFEVIAKIDKKEHLILENYYSIFHNGENSIVPHDSIQKKQQLLKSAGLIFFEEGEGYVNVRPHHLFYYNIFKNYVTDDYREYLALEAKDDEELWVADAGIGISWKELGDKVLGWENFVKKYPDSDLFAEANHTYSIYQYWFLFGLDNTSVMENSEGSDNYNKIYPEIKKDLEEFVMNHPESPAAKRAKRILDNEGKDYKKLNEEILKELKMQ